MGKKNPIKKLEEVARRKDLKIQFEEVQREEQEHSAKFAQRVVIVGQTFVPGYGKTIKHAKQSAAKHALRELLSQHDSQPDNPSAPPLVPKRRRSRGCDQGPRKREPLKTLATKGQNAPLCHQARAGKIKVAAKGEEEDAKTVRHDVRHDKRAEMLAPSAVYDRQVGSSTPLQTCDLDVFNYLGKLPNYQVSHQSEQPPRGITDDLPNASQNNNEEGKTPDGHCSIIPHQSGSYSENNKFKSKFSKIEQLGKGGFGSVFKGTEVLLKKNYAIKIVQCKKDALREVKALSDLQHPNIVRYYTFWIEDSQYHCGDASDSGSSTECTDDPSPKYLYIQMELCDTKTLRHWIEEKNTQKLRHCERRIASHHITLQILSGVEHIHSKKLIHRDLKPANIMFELKRKDSFDANTEDLVKIGDFGLVTAENDDQTGSLQERTAHKGTPCYMAPEQGNKPHYDRKVDIYPLGLTFFELLWQMQTRCELGKLWNDIRSGKLPKDFSRKFCEESIMISQMLCERPGDRPEASTLRSKLKEISQSDIEKPMRLGSQTF